MAQARQDIRIHYGFPTHHKVVKLCRIAGEKAFRCYLRLVFAQARRGAPEVMSHEKALVESGWDGAEAEWISALVESGLAVDRVDGIQLIPTMWWPVPRRRKIPKWLRDLVFRRDSRTCQHCGATSDLQLDHIRPVSKGGADTEANLQVLCAPCNIEKGAAWSG